MGIDLLSQFFKTGLRMIIGKGVVSDGDATRTRAAPARICKWDLENWY